MKDFISQTIAAQKLAEKAQDYYNGPEVIIRQLFYERKVNPPYTPNKFISPSGMSCPIACCYKLQGVELPESKESFFDRSKADAGTDRHERIQAFLSQTEYWVNVKEYVEAKKLPLIVLKEDGYEVLLQHKVYPIRFKCDGMLKIDGKYYVLEIKTEGEQKNLNRHSFNPDHEFQGATYSTVLDTVGVIWLYEGRDSCDPKTFLQEITTGDRQLIKKYISDIVKHKDNPFDKFVPEAKCTYCEYKNHCKKEYKEWKKKQPK